MRSSSDHFSTNFLFLWAKIRIFQILQSISHIQTLASHVSRSLGYSQTSRLLGVWGHFEQIGSKQDSDKQCDPYKSLPPIHFVVTVVGIYWDNWLHHRRVVPDSALIWLDLSGLDISQVTVGPQSMKRTNKVATIVSLRRQPKNTIVAFIFFFITNWYTTRARVRGIRLAVAVPTALLESVVQMAIRTA